MGMHARNPPVALLALGLALAAATTQASAATPIAVSERPHARVVTYAHGVRVTTLQLALHRSHHVLRGRVILAARSTTGRATTRTLRVGRCLRATPAAPICPPSTSITVHVPAHGSVSLTRSITLRQPGPRLDAVEARLVVPGAPTQRAFFHADAELLLPGRAWRGATAGHEYGVVLSSHDDAAVGRISVDGPATTPDRLYAFVVYTASGAALGEPVTTLLRSPPPAGDLGTPLTNSRGSGPQDFADRFDVEQRGASTFGIQVRGAGHLLARVLLPWPVGP
ncbi:MAG: hypothetical protein QOE11_3238 [Solirubrobacteraceae bacterium]|jgi:hypothetical protein|nr:hypothetical protein [Solirubrobacteraceae bacterium]